MTSDERAIGRLEGKIDSILAEQSRAADARRQMYATLERMDRKIDQNDRKSEQTFSDFKVALEAMDKRLQAVEEPVREFSRWRERAIGAAMLVSFVAAAVGGLIVTYGKKVWAAITGS